MKQLLHVVLVLSITSSIHAQSLDKIWERPGLEAPESVIAFGDHFYVSNVAGQPTAKNGKGYIAKLDRNGRILTQKWAVGFNAPKGLGIYGTELYVADIDAVVMVDLNEGSIKKRIEIEGATFLNDIAVSDKGTIFVSDTFGGNTIYQIKEGKVSVLLRSEELNYPNGLWIEGTALVISTWGVVTNPETFETEVPGKILRYDMKENTLKPITGSIGNLDGLFKFQNRYYVSDWIAGNVQSVDRNGGSQMVLDLNPGSADILYDAERGVLLIPEMLENKLTAYRFAQ